MDGLGRRGTKYKTAAGEDEVCRLRAVMFLHGWREGFTLKKAEGDGAREGRGERCEIDRAPCFFGEGDISGDWDQDGDQDQGATRKKRRDGRINTLGGEG